jgi:hypothetical protein
MDRFVYQWLNQEFSLLKEKAELNQTGRDGPELSYWRAELVYAQRGLRALGEGYEKRAVRLKRDCFDLDRMHEKYHRDARGPVKNLPVMPMAYAKQDLDDYEGNDQPTE